MKLDKPVHISPIFSPLLAQRLVSGLLVGVAVAQIVLVHLGLPGWPCPIRATTGILCPGCGLSTAISMLLRGEWRQSIETHAFAPLFLLAFVMMGLITILPGDAHTRVVRLVTRIEERTGIVAFLLIALLVYWGVRLTWLGFGPIVG